MKHDKKTDPFEDNNPLDIGIQAAFGYSSDPNAGASSTSSVLHVVGRTQKVPHLLLHEADQDDNAIIKARKKGAAGFPVQIDRYHIMGEIARGGVGLILKARDLDLGREVALKILLDKYRGNPEMIHRFLEEAQIGGQLQHPGILPVHEIGLYEVDRPYLAMKFVRGQTLAERLESRPFPVIERQHFLNIFEQICQTMAYAHSKGVIHRDLKPSNVMVGSFGEVQIVDWGLAKVLPKGGVADDKRSSLVIPDDNQISTWRSEELGSDSIAGSVMGTPAYMPPEQANGNVENISERSDVFGLGAILCEILTGKPPYTGISAEDAIGKAKEANLKDAIERLDNCGADKALIGIARSCLKVDPLERPRNALVVANKIQFQLESLETRARQLEVRTAKTRFRFILSLFVILGLVLSGIGYILAEKERENQEAISFTAAEKSCIEAEKLTAQAMAGRDLATWEAALREADRGLEIAGRSTDKGIKERAQQLRDILKVKVNDQRILTRIERIKEDRGSGTEEIQRSFQEVFSSIGVELETVSVQEAAKIMRDSSIKDSLVLALDQWSSMIGSGELEKKLFNLAQAADDDTWRTQLRATIRMRDPTDLSRMVEDAEVRELNPTTFELLAKALQPHPFHHRRRRSFENSEKAERIWRRAQEVHPDDFWINVKLGRFLRNKKAYDEALQYCRIAVALRPENGYARYELGSALAAKGNAVKALNELRKSILFDPDSPKGDAYYEAYRILENSDIKVPAKEIESLLLILQSIRESGDRLHFNGLIQLLACCQHTTGNIGDAILTLEDAVRQHGTQTSTGWTFRFSNRLSRFEQLRKYRKLLLPDIISYASIDTILENRLPDNEQAEKLDHFRKLHKAKKGGELPPLLYLDARLLQLENRPSEAIPLFRKITKDDQTLPEPFFHLAECLRGKGESGEAEQVLRKALKSLSTHCPSLWNLWTTIVFADLKWSAQELLNIFPVDSEPTLNSVADYSQNLLWSLNRLTSGKPILINCGGDDYKAPDDGSLWARDRFYNRKSHTFMGQGLFLGRVFFGEIAGTDHDPLYQTERWFPLNAGLPTGYRIPLPRGKYEVTLHFAEIFEGVKKGKRHTRIFDIIVEGKTVRKGYDPLKSGFAVADKFAVETVVKDGFLDIELVHINERENPKISAIAVQPAD